MSQTTRCPFCSTLFKVVADQLRISDGWVRCGHCKQVFDASQHLQAVATEHLLPDMPLDQLRAPMQPVARTVVSPRNWGDEQSERSVIETRPAQPPAPVVPDAAMFNDLAPNVSENRVLHVPERGVPAFLAAKEHLERGALKADANSADAPVFAWRSGPLSVQVPDTTNESAEPPLAERLGGYELPAALLPESDLDWLEDALEPEPEPEPEPEVGGEAASELEADLDFDGPVRHTWDAGVDAIAVDPASAQMEEGASGDNDADWKSLAPVQEREVLDEQELDEDESDIALEPSFVLAARRQALWRKPAVRAVLWLLVLLLISALVMQVALQKRNYLAAAWPQWRPSLEMACAPLHCRVGAYRDISSVVVDSSSFDKLRGNAYQFVITLKNRASMALEMPAVELTLTDAGGQPVLRRVFTRPDLSAPATLAARAEWSSTLSIQLAPLDSARIAGYRVLAFYP